MNLVTDIAKRLAEGVWDALTQVSSHAVNILAVLLVCFVVSFLPTWLIGVAVILLTALIAYATYKDILIENDKLNK